MQISLCTFPTNVTMNSNKIKYENNRTLWKISQIEHDSANSRTCETISQKLPRPFLDQCINELKIFV